MSIIKSFSVGNGDMFYIDHNSDNFTSIDCHYIDEDTRKAHFSEIKNLARKKGITRFISTHPDEDHIKGISEFCNEVGITNFYCVKNEATEPSETEAFKKYCELRDSSKAYYVAEDCSRKWMNRSDDERGSSGINFLWPDTSNDDFKAQLKLANEGTSFNNISPIFTYAVENSIRVIWMGDIEHDFLEKVKDEISWPEVDVLFAPHHGRKSGEVPSDVLSKLNPKLIVIGEAPSVHLKYYSNYNTITQNSAGDIVFDCGNKINIYVSSDTYTVSFLDDDNIKNSYEYGYYIGSFTPKEAK